MFLENVDEEAYDRANEADRLAVDRAGVRRPYRAVELPKPTGPGGVYTVDGLLALWSAHGKGRNFENGKRAFPPPAASSATASATKGARPAPT